MSFKLLILGCGSAVPQTKINPTAQLLNFSERLFLIDCGEGTQMQLKKHRVNFNKINNIFISHLHGDHFFGLIGLLSSFHLLKREKDVHIYSPKGLKEIIDVQLRITQTSLKFNIIFHEIEDTTTSKNIYDDGKIEVITIPLLHRVPTNGYLFREKPKQRLIDKNILSKYKIPVAKIKALKAGEDITLDDGTLLKNKDITLPAPKSHSYAFCSDTSYYEKVVNIIKGVDLLYHETTFLEKDIDRAAATYHSTVKQAATIALKAGVQKLIIGHYSQRYKEHNLFLEEAIEIFKNTELTQDGKRFKV